MIFGQSAGAGSVTGLALRSGGGPVDRYIETPSSQPSKKETSWSFCDKSSVALGHRKNHHVRRTAHAANLREAGGFHLRVAENWPCGGGEIQVE